MRGAGEDEVATWVTAGGIDQTMSLLAPDGRGTDVVGSPGVLLSMSVTFARSPTPTFLTETV